jgi:hypothetical protein
MYSSHLMGIKLRIGETRNTRLGLMSVCETLPGATVDAKEGFRGEDKRGGFELRGRGVIVLT